MRTASLSQIKKELQELSADEVLKICLQLARSKKENKEFLHYLLFESGNEAAYIIAIKEEVRNSFNDMNTSNIYHAKKSIRRILKVLKKYIHHSGKKETEIELLIFFCQELKASSLSIEENVVIRNIYLRQMNTIHKAMASLHEDLQYDYRDIISSLHISE